MKRKFWNWVKNETDESAERTLYLDGEISDETWYGDEVTPKLFKDELDGGKGNISVWINSPGGDVFAASAADILFKGARFDACSCLDVGVRYALSM